MKPALYLMLIVCMLLPFITPQSIAAEERLNEIFLLERPDKLLAFSGLRNNWFELKLHTGEKVIKSAHDGNVAVAYTSERALGFSGFTGRWSEERFRIHEIVESISAEGNVGTVITSIRALGFSASTGSWVESQFSIGN